MICIQAQGGCQMCLSVVKLDHSGKLFWDTPSWLSAWVSAFWAWRMDLNKGVPTLFAYCEKLIRKIFFKFKQGTCPWMAFAWIFFGIFSDFFLGRSVGQIIYREYIVFRGSNISCSLAWGKTEVAKIGRGLYSVFVYLPKTTELTKQTLIVAFELYSDDVANEAVRFKQCVNTINTFGRKSRSGCSLSQLKTSLKTFLFTSAFYLDSLEDLRFFPLIDCWCLCVADLSARARVTDRRRDRGRGGETEWEKGLCNI